MTFRFSVLRTYRFVTVLAFLFLNPSWSAEDKSYKAAFVQKNSETLEVRITLDMPEWITQDGKDHAWYKGAQLRFDEHGALVPSLSRLINLPSARARVAVREARYGKAARPEYFTDRSSASGPAAVAELQYLGLYRGMHMHALRIMPVTYDPATSTVTLLTSLTIDVSYDRAETDHAASVSPETVKNLNPLLLDSAMPLNTVYSVPERESVTEYTSPDLFAKANLFRMTLKETGLYKVTYDQLEKAGFPVGDIDPRKLSVYNKGKEIPLYMKGSQDGRFDPEDFFEFWGERNEKTMLAQFPDAYNDPFSDSNTYWLASGGSNGLRLVEESGGIGETRPGRFRSPFAFTETLHFEQDNFYAILGRADKHLHRPAYEMDHWFYDNGINAVGSRSYEFYLPYPLDYGAQVFVSAMFRGASYYSESTNPLIGHQTAVWVNDQKVGEVLPSERWTDQDMREIRNTAGIAQTALQHGTNQLRVDMEQTGVTDIVMLNWFDVTYQREYRADRDFIRFRLTNGFPTDRIIQFNVDGFSTPDISVYKLGTSKVINNKIDYFQDDQRRTSSYRVALQDTIIDPSAEYVALTEKVKKTVTGIAPFSPWKPDSPGASILDKSNKADLLIITHDLLRETARQYQALKEEQGLDVELVTVQQIYDVFNHGIKSAIAIKNFITHAFYEWQQPGLEYVVFVGDASYDYKGYRSAGADLVPTMMFETYNYGAAASDYWYALISGDDFIPDVIVSRIPAQTNQQLQDYVTKIQNYQHESNTGAWRNSALFISGNDDPTKGSNLENITNKPVFRAQSLRLINMKLPEEMFAYRLNTVRDAGYPGGFDPDFGGKTDLLDYFNDGLSFINFLGHGGGGIWADVNLLDLNDVSRLNNGTRLPFIASMTCFTGAFENPGKDGLSERLVMAADRGAIAALASSGLGWLQNDFVIEWALFDFLWDDELTFGQAVDLMKIYYMMNPIYITEEKNFFTFGYYGLVPSMVAQYNLLGDPALKIQKPSGKVTVTVSNHTPFPGDTVSVSVSGPLQNASFRIEISDINNRKLVSATVSSGTEPLYRFAVPEGSGGERYFVKVYMENGQQDAAGMTEIAVARSMIQQVLVSPENPEVHQPVELQIVARSAVPIKEMRCLNFRNFNTTRTLNLNIPMTQVSDTLFKTGSAIPGFDSEGLKYFDIFVVTQDDSQYTFRWRELMISDSRPDLEIRADAVRYSGTNKLNLDLNVTVMTSEVLDNVVISCSEMSGDGSEIPLYNGTHTFIEAGEKTIPVELTDLSFKRYRTYKVKLDATNVLEERDEANNALIKTVKTDRILVAYQQGTSMDGTANDTLSLSDAWQLFIPAGSLTATSVVSYEFPDITESLRLGKQKDLRFIPVVHQNDTSVVHLKILNQTATLTQPARLSAFVDRSGYSSDLWQTISFFRYDPYLGLWVASPSVWASDRLETLVTESGRYGVFSFYDDEDPVIEITVDGRPMVENMLVTKNPALAFLLQDANGVNLSGSFRLLIDGQPLSQDQMTYPDSIQNANTVAILTTPEFSRGEHKLEVEIQDISGNRTEKSVNFSVSGEFDIIVHGNYPNPFSDETILSYFINSNGPIDEFSVKIYSTSGRLVRSEPLLLDETVTDDLITAPNYHELIWDGTDDDGNLVANGVYFAVIKGKYEGKTVKHTIKMAKLQ